jgi:hypothetical protein
MGYINCLNCLASNEVKNGGELEKIREEVANVCFKVVPGSLPDKTKKNHKKLQGADYMPKYELGTSQIQI